MSGISQNKKANCCICKKEFSLDSPSDKYTYNKGIKKLKNNLFCSMECYRALDKTGMGKGVKKTGAYFRAFRKKIGRIIKIKDNTGKVRKYIYLPGHPSGDNVSYSRWIMETKLRRFLNPGEIVHHMNSNPSDDRIENLRVLESVSHHALNHKMSNSTAINYYSDNSDILEMLYEVCGTKKYISNEMPDIFNGKEMSLSTIHYGNYQEGHSINCLTLSPFFKK